MKTWLQSKRFFIQALTLTLGILLILCIFFVVILYTNSKKSTSQTIYQIESDRNMELLRQAEIHFSQLVEIGASYGTLMVPYEALTSSQDLWVRKVYDAMISSHKSSNKYIFNINANFLGNSLYPSEIAHEKHLWDFYFYEIYVEDSSPWPYYIDLTLKNEIKNFRPVTITLDGYMMSEQLFSTDSKERLEYLLTPHNTVLLTNQKRAFFQQIDDLLPGINLSEFDPARQFLQTYDDYYYMLSSTDKYGFRVLSLVPQSFYSNHYDTVLLQALLLTSSLFLIAIVISYFLATHFYRPIRETINLLKTYIPDDIETYENEIAYIHENIAKYVSKENSAPSNTQKTFSNLQTAQTAVLQYQINSHFLFNTLENIKALSITELGMDNEIETCIIMLNTIIHEGIFHKKIFVPLSEELHLVKCYLELMRLRFFDVEVHWSVDDSLLQCQVYKFSLQPVLENCFAHAFIDDLDRQKTITIMIQQDDNALSLIVKDNGIGIDSSTLYQIEQILNTSEELNYSRHVGIRNVHKRINDVFGPGYGIRITSANPGTIVEIRYPLP